MGFEPSILWTYL